jgi:hypothetical protein
VYQLLVARGANSTTGTTWYLPVSGDGGTGQTAAGSAHVPWPAARVARNLRVVHDSPGAAGSGDRWRVTLLVDDTVTLQLTFAGDQTELVTAPGQSAALGADQRVVYRIEWLAGGTAPAANWWFSLDLEGGPDTEAVAVGTGLATQLSTTATRYVSPLLPAAPTGTETNVTVRPPVAITVTSLRVLLDAAPGGSYTCTLRRELANTTATVTISGSATSGTWSGQESWAAGARLGLSATPSGSPAAARISVGITYTLAVAHRSILCGVSSSGPSTTAATRNSLARAGTWLTGHRTLHFGRRMTLRGLWVNVTTAPGAGKSWTFRLRAGPAGETALNNVVTISDTATFGNDSLNTDVVALAYVQIEATPSGTPSAAGVTAWSVIVDRDAPLTGTTTAQARARVDTRAGRRIYWRQWFGPSDAPGQIQLAPGDLLTRLGAQNPDLAAVTLNASLIHGSAYAADVDRVYLSSRDTLPNTYKLIRLDPASLSFTSYSSPDGFQADALVIAGQRIFVSVDSVAGGGSDDTVIDEFRTTDGTPVLVARRNLGALGRANSLAVSADGQALFVGTRGISPSTPPRILRVALSTFTVTHSYVLDADVPPTAYVHALEADADYVFATTFGGNAYVYRLREADLSGVTRAGPITGNALTDDMALVGQYLYCGLEATGSARGLLVRIHRDELTFETFDVGPPDANCFGVRPAADSRYLWAVYDASPGELAYIDTTDMSFRRIWLPAAYTRVNEVVTRGSTEIFLTTWTSPAQVVRCRELIPAQLPLVGSSEEQRHSFWVPIRLYCETAPTGLSNLRLWSDGTNSLAVPNEPPGQRTILGNTASAYTQATGVEDQYGTPLNTTNYPSLAGDPVEIWGWTSASPLAIPSSGTPTDRSDFGSFVVLQARLGLDVITGTSPAETLTWAWREELGAGSTSGSLTTSRMDLDVTAVVGPAKATLTAVGTLSAAAVSILRSGAALTGVGSVAVAATRVVTASAALTGAATVAAQASVVTTGTAALGAAGLVQTTGRLVGSGSSVIAGTASVQSSGRLVASGATVSTGVTALQAAGRTIAAGTVACTGVATLTATGAATANGAVAMLAQASVAAAGHTVARGSAGFTGVAVVSATAAGEDQPVSVSIVAVGTLSAAGRSLLTGSAAIAAAGTLNAVPLRVRAAGTAATGVGQLSAAAIVVRTGTAAISGVGTLQTIALAVRTGSAAITAVAVVAVQPSVLRLGSTSLTGVASLIVAVAAGAGAPAAVVAVVTLRELVPRRAGYVVAFIDRVERNGASVTTRPEQVVLPLYSGGTIVTRIERRKL